MQRVNVTVKTHQKIVAMAMQQLIVMVELIVQNVCNLTNFILFPVCVCVCVCMYVCVCMRQKKRTMYEYTNMCILTKGEWDPTYPSLAPSLPPTTHPTISPNAKSNDIIFLCIFVRVFFVGVWWKLWKLAIFFYGK